ncbi:MAG: hypothetical protein U5K56_19495 [Halioglobus sp.]|nr:hypothetical protein [Halioglobus sp.]
MSQLAISIDADGGRRWFWTRGVPAALAMSAATAVTTYVVCAVVAGLLP